MMKKILKSIFVCIIMITTLLVSVNYIKADDSEATYDGIKYRPIGQNVLIETAFSP